MSYGCDHVSEFLRRLDEVSRLDVHLVLAVDFGRKNHAVLIPACELGPGLHQILRDMSQGQRLEKFRIALTHDSDPDLALARLTNEDLDSNLAALASTPQLLELLLEFIEGVGIRPSPEPTVDARYLKASARWLTRLGVRILPVPQRSRYLAEFTADLATLPRREQLKYAIRVTCRAVLLRHVLKRSRLRVPAHRK